MGMAPQNFGEHTKFGYKDFIPMFTAPKFDPKQWAKLFKKAGAKYVMPVAEHHDGFQMYDSEISDWTSVKMAMKRDVLGELKEAIQEEDMIFCESNHRVEHAFFMGHGCEFDSDIKQPMKLGDFIIRPCRNRTIRISLVRRHHKTSWKTGLHEMWSWLRNIVLPWFISTGGFSMNR